MTDTRYPHDRVIRAPSGPPSVRALLAAGEGPHVDFKLECNAFYGSVDANAEVVKDICALANGSPAAPRCAGVLVFGVGDDRVTFRSVRNSNLTDDNLQDLVRKSLDPPPDVHLCEEYFENAGELHVLKLVRVMVRDPRIVRIKRDLPGNGRGARPIHRMNEVWVRRGSTSELASPEDMLSLHERNHPREPTRTPRLSLLASASSHGPASSEVNVMIPELPQLSVQERRMRVEALLAKHRPIYVAAPLPGLGGRPYEQVCSMAEIERYEREAVQYVRACEEFVEADEAYERARSRSVFLYLDLMNTGTAPATDTVLTIEAPDGVHAQPAVIGTSQTIPLVRPRPPVPPTPPRPDTRAPLNQQPIPQAEKVHGAAPRSRPQPESVTGPLAVTHTVEGRRHLLRYEARRVPHGEPLLLNPIEVSFEEHITDIALSYTIRADELEQHIQGRILVRVERGTIGAAET